MNDVYREKPATSALLVTNVILGGLILVIAGVSVYFRYFYRPEFDPQAVQSYVAEARERLDRHADTIAGEAAGIAEEVGPPIAETVYEQVQEDYPRYIHTLKAEGKEYFGNVEQTFVAEVKSRYAGYLRRHRDLVKEEFPEHASDENVEAVLADFEQTFNRLLERYYLDEFRRQADRTVQLWDQVEPAPVPGPDQPSLDEQLADYMADWTVLALSDKAEEQLTSESAPTPGNSAAGESTSSPTSQPDQEH